MTCKAVKPNGQICGAKPGDAYTNGYCGKHQNTNDRNFTKDFLKVLPKGYENTVDYTPEEVNIIKLEAETASGERIAEIFEICEEISDQTEGWEEAGEIEVQLCKNPNASEDTYSKLYKQAFDLDSDRMLLNLAGNAGVGPTILTEIAGEVYGCYTTYDRTREINFAILNNPNTDESTLIAIGETFEWKGDERDEAVTLQLINHPKATPAVVEAVVAESGLQTRLAILEKGWEYDEYVYSSITDLVNPDDTQYDPIVTAFGKLSGHPDNTVAEQIETMHPKWINSMLQTGEYDSVVIDTIINEVEKRDQEIHPDALNNVLTATMTDGQWDALKRTVEAPHGTFWEEADRQRATRPTAGQQSLI